MKIRKYEKYHLVYFSIIVLMITECIFFLSLRKFKMEFYQQIPAIVEDKHTLIMTISKKEKITLYKSNFFYINNKKTKYKVIKENKLIIQNKKYYEITIQVETEINNSEKEVVEITIIKEKERIIRIFQKVKDGG